jgi:hypothetical protein
LGPVYGTYAPYTSDEVGAVAGIAALGLGVNGLGAGVASSLVITVGSGRETPDIWANTGAATKRRAAVVIRKVIAISSKSKFKTGWVLQKHSC